jgi:hypothetical protein
MLRPSSTLPSRSETSCLLGEAPQTRHWVWRSFFRIGCRLPTPTDMANLRVRWNHV